MKPKANWTSLLKTKAHSFRELRWLSDLTWAGAVDGSIMTHIRHAEDPGAQQVLIGAVGRSIGRRPADERKQNNDGERAHPYDARQQNSCCITVELIELDSTRGFLKMTGRKETSPCPSRPSAYLQHWHSLLTSRVLVLNLYSNDHMTRVMWHASERALAHITSTKIH